MICRVCTNPADILLDGRLYPDTTIMSAIRTVANITVSWNIMCLKVDTTWHYHYTHSGEFRNLDCKLNVLCIIYFQINNTDYYPKYICTPCLEDLKTAYHFKRKCEASDMMFRKAIPSVTLISK